jgi:hypothetical protein
MQMLIVALAAALVAIVELGIAVAPAQAGDIPSSASTATICV